MHMVPVGDLVPASTMLVTPALLNKSAEFCKFRMSRPLQSSPYWRLAGDSSALNLKLLTYKPKILNLKL